MGLKQALDLSKVIQEFMQEEARSYQRVKHLYPRTYYSENQSSKAS